MRARFARGWENATPASPARAVASLAADHVLVPDDVASLRRLRRRTAPSVTEQARRMLSPRYPGSAWSNTRDHPHADQTRPAFVAEQASWTRRRQPRDARIAGQAQDRLHRRRDRF